MSEALRARSFLGVFAVLAVAALVGCGGAGIGLASGTLVLDPRTVVFGPPKLDTPQDQWVKLSNTGKLPVHVASIAVSSDPNVELIIANVLTSDCRGGARKTPLTLAPGECARFFVRWIPSLVHAASGGIAIESDAQGQEHLVLEVSGTTVDPSDGGHGDGGSHDGGAGDGGHDDGGAGDGGHDDGGAGDGGHDDGGSGDGGHDDGGAGDGGHDDGGTGDGGTYDDGGTGDGGTHDDGGAGDGGPQDGGSGPTALLQVCVLTASGAVDEAACSRLSDAPPFMPTLDFGNLTSAAGVSRGVRFKNEGTGTIVFSGAGPHLASTSNQGFSITSSQVLSLAPQDTATITIQFTPPEAGSFSGALVFASNDTRPGQGSLAIAASIDVPRLCVSVPGLGFSGVAVGQSQSAVVTVTNCGAQTLLSSVVTISPVAPTTNEFTVAGASGTIALVPGGSVALTITYAPTAVRTDTASLQLGFVTQSAQSVSAAVALSGQSVSSSCQSLIAGIDIRSADSTASIPNGHDRRFELGADLVLSGASSTAPSGATYDWSVIGAPDPSVLGHLGTGLAQAVPFTVAGKYTFKLTVSSGSCNATASATLIAVGAVHVELTWPEDHGDLDLHYVGPQGTLWERLNQVCPTASTGTGLPCGDTSFDHLSPDWGCAAFGCSGGAGVFPDGDTKNDPRLIADVNWGFGPEIVEHVKPGDGDYSAWATNWCTHLSTSPAVNYGPSTATIKVWAHGTLAFTAAQSLNEAEQWQAAVVHVSGSSVTVSSANATPQTAPYACQ